MQVCKTKEMKRTFGQFTTAQEGTEGCYLGQGLARIEGHSAIFYFPIQHCTGALSTNVIRVRKLYALIAYRNLF